MEGEGGWDGDGVCGGVGGVAVARRGDQGGTVVQRPPPCGEALQRSSSQDASQAVLCWV